MGSGGPSRPEPPRKRGAGRMRVERLFDHAPDTRSMFLSIVGGGKLKFVPGQFISISIPLGDETRTRPYSLASSPDDSGPLEICFNRVTGGRGVAWLFDRVVGDELDFTGPFGTFTLDRGAGNETVFIAEGTAIAPIRPMVRRALSAPITPQIHLLYGADRDDHLLYISEFDQLRGGHPQFRFDTVIERGDALYDRLYAEAERRWIVGDTERSRQFFICGIGKGVIRIRDLLRGNGYERRSVHYEQW